jgi:hypothetical protein
MTTSRLVPLLGLLVAACGSGVSSAPGGPSTTGTPGSASDTPNQSDLPASGSTTPSSGTDIPPPPGGGSTTAQACAIYCDLFTSYPCLVGDVQITNCMTYCEQQLASDAKAALCAGPTAALLACADKAGMLSCTDNGDLHFDQGITSACANELAAVPQDCKSTSTNNNDCKAPSCSGCQDACSACECAGLSDCSAACGQTGTCEYPTCANCATTCDSCLCATQNDQTTCASLCGG